MRHEKSFRPCPMIRNFYFRNVSKQKFPTYITSSRGHVDIISWWYRDVAAVRTSLFISSRYFFFRTYIVFYGLFAKLHVYHVHRRHSAVVRDGEKRRGLRHIYSFFVNGYLFFTLRKRRVSLKKKHDSLVRERSKRYARTSLRSTSCSSFRNKISYNI